jgi:hypothetical protein
MGKEALMNSIPKVAEPLIRSLAVAFTRPTFQRVVVLFVGAILSLRRRTVTGMLWPVGTMARGHWSDFHRVFCRASWSLWPLGKALAAMILEWIPADQPVIVSVDDTTPQHKGQRVYGKGRHHDAVRSTHSHVVWVWGHKWVTLAIHVRFPFAARAWALPVLCALYRSEELNRAEGRRHRTPIRLTRPLMAALIHWFPQRKFILVGDGGYASHELARFCHRHHRHVTLVSRFHRQANLYDAPTRRRLARGGRPAIKGRKRAAPAAVVQRSSTRRFTVSWYGGQRRRVELISEASHWYKAGDGLTPVRWVFVRDVQGTHRDEYLYSTDPTLRPDQIVSLFTARWSIEVTFQEVRAHLGFTTPRNWSKPSVLRTAPCLLGLFSLVSLIYARHRRDRAVPSLSTAWYTKYGATFSDAITTVRRLCWESVLKESWNHTGITKLPTRLRRTLLDHLSHAA